MNPDAQVYLAARLAEIRDGPPRLHGAPTDDEHADRERAQHQQRTYGSFTSELRALEAVGAVEASEVHEWTNRCLEALGEEPLEPVAARPGRAVMRLVHFGDDPRREVVPPPVPEFVRLVPASTPAAVTRHGGRFQVLGVEIYDTELALAWRLAPLPNEESMSAKELDELDADTEGLPDDTREVMRLGLLQRRRLRLPLCEIGDDVGTEYRATGGGSSGGGGQLVGRARYTPAPPPQASHLTVRWEDVSHLVPLR